MSNAAWRIEKLVVKPAYTLSITFKDGLEGDVTFTDGFFRGVFQHLKNEDAFKQAQIVNGAVTWPANLDLAPDAMYRQIKQHGAWRVTE